MTHPAVPLPISTLRIKPATLREGAHPTLNKDAKVGFCILQLGFPYNIFPYKRSPDKGRILMSDILGRRRPVGFMRESYPIRGGTL
jgi:hypothetical protein